jgi:hypothetical protein
MTWGFNCEQCLSEIRKSQEGFVSKLHYKNSQWKLKRELKGV